MATQQIPIPERPRRRKQTGEIIDLPKHVRLSETELANTVRLVSVLREEYWLSYFIEALLQLDAEGTAQVPIKAAEDMLVHMKNLAGWQRAFDTMASGMPTLRNHAAVLKWPGWNANAGDEGEDMDFCELVQIWRRDHPVPPPKQHIPAGYLLSHKDDPKD